MSAFANPILPGFHADPTICRVGGDYYLATSTFEYFPGVPLYHSKDLLSWRLIGHALTRSSQLQLAGAKSSQGIFAPTLRHHAGTFYMVTTNMSSGGSFYVTAEDPAGPWSDPVWLPEPVLTMDPSLLFDDDGAVYYTRHGGGRQGGIYQAELDLKQGRLKSEPREIWRGTGGIWPEGPHLYRIHGYYYLLISEGGTSYDHSLTVARSRSPWGPFEPCPHNPIFTHRDRPDEPIQALGHGDLVQTPDGHWFIVLLGIRPSGHRVHHIGRETFLAPVTWSHDGWPVVNGGAPLKLLASAAGLPPRASWPAEPARDDFDRPELDRRWTFIRNPSAECWSLRARPGFLRLIANAVSLDDPGSPAFVGRPQEHLSARASTLLDYTPQSEGERAGLTLRANELNHYDLSITLAQGRRSLELRTRVAGVTTRLALEPLGDGPVVLGVDAQPDRYELWFASEGRERRTLGTAPTAPLSSEQAGGFTGVYIGLFAVSTGEASAGAAAAGGPSTAAAGATPAEFDWFEYDELS
jgi:alpha-N-arabinofuranosidase